MSKKLYQYPTGEYPEGYDILLTTEERHHDIQMKHHCILRAIPQILDRLSYVSEEEKLIVECI